MSKQNVEVKRMPKGTSPNPLRDSSSFNFLIMKNLIFVLAFSLMSFSIVNECHDYANSAIQDEIDYYGPMSSADEIEGYVWYYEACSEAGGAGNIGAPVLV